MGSNPQLDHTKYLKRDALHYCLMLGIIGLDWGDEGCYPQMVSDCSALLLQGMGQTEKRSRIYTLS